MENITGKRLRKLRNEAGMTGDELGKILGCTKTAISYWETGRVKIDDVTLVKIAQLFNVTTDYLLGNDHLKKRSTEAHDYEQNIEKLDDNVNIVYSDLAGLDDSEIAELKQFYNFIKSKKK